LRDSAPTLFQKRNKLLAVYWSPANVALHKIKANLSCGQQVWSGLYTLGNRPNFDTVREFNDPLAHRLLYEVLRAAGNETSIHLDLGNWSVIDRI